jgi:hypothetical protein
MAKGEGRRAKGEGRRAKGEGRRAKGGFSRERIEAELKNGRRLPMWQVLRCRVRYFTERGNSGSSGKLVSGAEDMPKPPFGSISSQNRAEGLKN